MKHFDNQIFKQKFFYKFGDNDTPFATFVANIFKLLDDTALGVSST
jgi:hypothetical protein